MFGPSKTWLALHTLAWPAVAAGGHLAVERLNWLYGGGIWTLGVVLLLLLVYWGAYIAGGWLRYRRPRAQPIRVRGDGSVIRIVGTLLWLAWPVASAAIGFRDIDHGDPLDPLQALMWGPPAALFFVIWLVAAGFLWVEWSRWWTARRRARRSLAAGAEP